MSSSHPELMVDSEVTRLREKITNLENSLRDMQAKDWIKQDRIEHLTADNRQLRNALQTYYDYWNDESGEYLNLSDVEQAVLKALS